jgi:hypothetical protein
MCAHVSSYAPSSSATGYTWCGVLRPIDCLIGLTVFDDLAEIEDVDTFRHPPDEGEVMG